jgi:Spy/CpxP family protein refolding chaperone
MRRRGSREGLRLARPAVFATLALAWLAGPALAQQGPPQGRGMPSVDERLTQMTEQLRLTEDQAAKVRPILEKQDRQRDELFEKYGGDRETMRAEMRKLVEEGDAELAGVLTEQQMKMHVEQRQQRMRQGPPGGRQGGRPGGRAAGPPGR